MDTITDEKPLHDHLADQCKPPDQCLIGLEHEKFLLARQARRPLPYAGPVSIEAVLTELQRFGWKPAFEGENLTGLTRDGAAITLEPAGQLELSGRPWPDLHDVCAELREHRRQLTDVADAMGLDVMALGYAPHWQREDVAWMPKSRYRIMRGYMPRVGVHGLDMMTRTCSLQLNFDFVSEQDMCDKYRVAMALQPLVMVALANAPFADGRDSGLTSYRNYVWLHTDSARCGLLPGVLAGMMGFADYVDLALDTPMYSVARGGAHVDLAGRSFRDMLRGELHEMPGERPDLDDWTDHLNTLMHDVRLKGHLELRGNDSLSLEQSMALAAYWTGILYDDRALKKALSFIEGCDVARLNQLRHGLAQLGMAESDRVDVAGCYRAESLLEALETTLALAEEGLGRRQRLDAGGEDETRYLKPLFDIVEARRSPAEQLRARLQREGSGSLAAVARSAAF